MNPAKGETTDETKWEGSWFEDRADSNSGRNCIHGGVRVRGDESLELADAGAVRRSSDHLLAGPRHIGPEWHPSRRVPRPLRRDEVGPADDGAVGAAGLHADDARGTGEVPRRAPAPLRRIRGEGAGVWYLTLIGCEEIAKGKVGVTLSEKGPNCRGARLCARSSRVTWNPARAAVAEPCAPTVWSSPPMLTLH